MKRRMSGRSGFLMIAIFVALGFTVCLITPALADNASNAAQLVQKATRSFENFAAAKDLAGFHDLLKKAKGVMISPQVLEGAFVFGMSGGSGVFVVRDPKTGRWKGPAFYTIGEASFGLQAGAKDSQVIMLAMTERGVNALLSPSVKLGADISGAAGPVGAGASAATANISADIVSYSLSKGLYGGLSLEGAVVAVRKEWNEAYYKKPGVTPTDILIRGDVSNRESAKLLTSVSKAAGATKTAAQSEASSRYYEVQSGDSLYEIAKKNGTTVEALVKLNHIKDAKRIYPGQKLLLPTE